MLKIKSALCALVALTIGASAAYAANSPTQGATAADVIKQLGAPKEIIERALLHETEYRFKNDRRIILHNGVVVNGTTASESFQSVIPSSAPRPRLIRAGELAQNPTASTLTTTLADINKEQLSQQKTGPGGAPGAPADPAPFVNSDAGSDS